MSSSHGIQLIHVLAFFLFTVLHFWANMRRTVQAPKYWSTTDFHMQDLWKVDLSNADVIAVYGLHPIMKRLRKKMESELKPGSIVGEF